MDNVGWGSSRFDTDRPVSLQPDSTYLSPISAESSSENETQSISSVSGVKASKSKEDRRGGVFRIFGRKVAVGGDKDKDKDREKVKMNSSSSSSHLLPPPPPPPSAHN